MELLCNFSVKKIKSSMSFFKIVVQKCSANAIVVQKCSANTLNITFCSAKMVEKM